MTEFSPQAVHDQLARITASEEFDNAEKLRQFLGYVVEKTLENHPRRIKQYSIAVEALGYGEDFNPDSNTTVRLLAGRLRRALERYYARQGYEDSIRIDIPKGQYVPIFSLNRAVTTTTDKSASMSEAAVEALPQAKQPTIAIIEFANLSDQSSHEHLAKGLTAEILTGLNRFAELSVIGPFVEMPGQAIDFGALNCDYDADFALQGWARAHDSEIRITADLLELPHAKSSWGETFKFDLNETSLFDIEDAVADGVVGAIADGVGPIFRKLYSGSYGDHTRLSGVTQAVLAFNHAWQMQTPQAWAKANEIVRDGMKKYPENALLLALQSNIYYADVLYCLDLFPGSITGMQELANEAISLDPELQMAQYNLVVQHAFFGRRDKCVDTARRVKDINPNNAVILAGCAVATSSVGAYELGKALIEAAKERNPRFPGWYLFVDYLIDFKNERYEQVWVHAQRMYLKGLIWHPILRAAVLGMLGRMEEAHPYIEELQQIKPEFKARPHDFLRRLLVTDEHVEMIWDGLLKAGIQD
jgi:adenylate cyclase